MTVYIFLSVVLIIVSLFPLRKFLEIGYLSLAPLILCLVSILQGFEFKSCSNTDKDRWRMSSTAYSVRETDYAAYANSMKYHSVTKFAIIPPLILFVFYFTGWLKILLSVVIYFVSYIVAFVLARSKTK